jgi:hypothetical protein
LFLTENDDSDSDDSDYNHEKSIMYAEDDESSTIFNYSSEEETDDKEMNDVEIESRSAHTSRLMG